MIVGIEQWKIKLEEEANSEIVSADTGIECWGLWCWNTILGKKEKKKKLAPSSILRKAKVAYYARNIFEVGRFVCIS